MPVASGLAAGPGVELTGGVLAVPAVAPTVGEEVAGPVEDDEELVLGVVVDGEVLGDVLPGDVVGDPDGGAGVVVQVDAGCGPERE